MNGNNYSFILLSDGTIKMDGGSVFGQVPRANWQELVTPDRHNRIRLGLNCLLVRNGKQCILIDTGVGTKEPGSVREAYGLGSSRLLKELRARDLTPRDITAVVLTHLHFDHCGGATRLDRSGMPVPTFPNATYYVQRTAWEEAVDPNERASSVYHSDDFLPLQESRQLELLDGDCEVVPGVWAKVTDAHTKGDQMVLLNHGGERLAFLGDLIPTPYHLQLSCIAAMDRYPEATLQHKRKLLRDAEREGWLVLFSHGFNDRAGYVENRDGKSSFRPVEF
ncbi:MAG: hypothetical protein BZY82_00265 [SAR202 cluster bacterium Io17-Chloro-G3]|nr:MAG: hypothetical protein BZY82_00265 [SAR202 cluster bacterium Io17-Chloro-G3]